MNSITKNKLNEKKIKELYYTAFDNIIKIASITELTGGFFNHSYCIHLKNGKKIVLKIAPKKSIKVLRYEANLMYAEVSALNKILSLGKVPVPKVLHFDTSHELIDTDYVFLEYIEGIPLNNLRNLLTKNIEDKISSSLGDYIRTIGNITGDYFGFINIESNRYSDWYICFKMMISDLIDDANDLKISLPIEKKEANSLIERYESVLKKVVKPSLIHKDLWDQNIIINPNTNEISGIIDCERALYGDKLLEISCGFLDENPIFISHYYGKMDLDNCEKIRIELYKFYLYLIMVIECPYRQYEDPSQETWARKKLDESIEKLNGYYDL